MEWAHLHLALLARLRPLKDRARVVLGQHALQTWVVALDDHHRVVDPAGCPRREVPATLPAPLAAQRQELTVPRRGAKLALTVAGDRQPSRLGAYA